jgi:hypothetical protein
MIAAAHSAFSDRDSRQQQQQQQQEEETSSSSSLRREPLADSSGPVLITKARYAYSNPDKRVLSVSKGDELHVLGSEADWYRCLHVQTRLQGLVPKNYCT